MIWHVITTLGPKDLYAPELGPRDPRILVPLHHPTSPWRVGNDTERVLIERLGVKVAPVVQDLVRLAVAVFTADLRVTRDRTDDRWQRQLKLYQPVSDPSAWRKAAPVLVQLLNFLSGDEWEVDFRQSELSESVEDVKAEAFDRACLFSGGLDSLVGAIDVLAAGHRAALVSHHGLGDGTKTIQSSIVSVLEESFPGRIVHLPFFVHPDRGNTNEGENTMRSRSLLFMAMGIAVASASNSSPTLVVPENGLISLNVPLTGARTGSLSTRTTHPYYVVLFRELLDSLGIGIMIELPYRHLTKGEMLRQSAHPEAMAKTAPQTMSCSHPTVGRYAGKAPGNHCGYCVPCIIRYASLKAAGIASPAPDWDIIADPPPDSSERAHDVRAFRIGIERLRGSDPRHDVFKVLRSGPIPAQEAKQFAEVYRRGMREVATFLGITLN